MTLREQLLEMADGPYLDFIMPLMPGVEQVIGVRLPLLRRIAREIVRGDWRAWLAANGLGVGSVTGNGPEGASDAGTVCFEERMLQGMTIGYAPCPIEEKLRYVARFAATIDNWAVCDSFCWRLKPAERAAMWDFIQPYFSSEAPYEVRFAVVMGLNNFVDEEHLDALLALLGGIRSDHYYVRMGVAWAVSICFVKFPRPTRAWLSRACPLDDWTYNKSLRKIVESLRVDATTKQEICALKRGAEKRRGRRTFAK